MIYERVIPRLAKGKALVGNVILIACYALGLILAVAMLPVSVYLTVLWVLATLFLFLFTNKYLRVEYEYFFDAETFGVAKIYSKRSRRAVLDIDLRKTLLTAPADEENLARAARLNVECELNFTSGPDAADVYFTVFEDERERKTMVLFEGDERSLKYFKRANPIATTVRPFTNS